MSSIVDCSCGKKLKVPDHLLGKKIKCPSCGEVISSANDILSTAPISSISASSAQQAPVMSFEERHKIIQASYATMDLATKKIVFAQDEKRKEIEAITGYILGDDEFLFSFTGGCKVWRYLLTNKRLIIAEQNGLIKSIMFDDIASITDSVPVKGSEYVSGANASIEVTVGWGFDVKTFSGVYDIRISKDWTNVHSFPDKLKELISMHENEQVYTDVNTYFEATMNRPKFDPVYDREPPPYPLSVKITFGCIGALFALVILMMLILFIADKVG